MSLFELFYRFGRGIWVEAGAGKHTRRSGDFNFFAAKRFFFNRSCTLLLFTPTSFPSWQLYLPFNLHRLLALVRRPKLSWAMPHSEIPWLQVRPSFDIEIASLAWNKL